jgi:fatty-acyl-CoA synthase
MLQFLEGKIAKWWMPDDVAFVDDIPLGAPPARSTRS